MAETTCVLLEERTSKTYWSTGLKKEAVAILGSVPIRYRKGDTGALAELS